jgi:hypothetical protein
MTPCDACGRPPELGEETMSTTNPVKPPGVAVTTSGALVDHAPRGARRRAPVRVNHATVKTGTPGLDIEYGQGLSEFLAEHPENASRLLPAAPARSPDPASPPSTPARKTRTAHPRDPAPPPGGQYVPPTLPAHRWLHAGRACRPGKTQPPQQMPSAGPEPVPSCSCTPATTRTSGKTRRHKAVPLSAGETWQKDLNHRAEAPKGIKTPNRAQGELPALLGTAWDWQPLRGQRGDGHRAGRLGAVRDAGKRRACVWRSVRGIEPPSTPKTWRAISGWSAAVRYSASSLGEGGVSQAVLIVSSNPLAVMASRRCW